MVVGSKPSKPVVDVKVKKSYNRAWDYFYYKIIITALEDGIQIKNVRVNNGNCKKIIYEGNTLDNLISENPPQEALKLGETLKVRLNPQCNPIKVEVNTNKGDWVWNFEP